MGDPKDERVHVHCMMRPDADNDGGPSVTIPLDRFERLLKVLERLAILQERSLAQDEDNARRALSKIGPTTAEAEARVEAKLRRLRGK